ncbi:MAG: LVIVD repeat-containing protein [bacterium]
MHSEKNINRTIISTIHLQYTQEANRLFPWVVIFIAFLFSIMAFVTPTHLQAAYTMHFGTAVVMQGDYAYVAVTGTSHSATDVIYMTPPGPELPSGLRVIDISDPDSPEIVGGLDYSNSGMLSIAVEGDLVYLAYSGTEGVKIIDISNPEKPKIIGTIKNVYAREMVVRDSYAYIADPYSGLVIFDVSNSSSPVRAARLNLNGTVEDIAVQGDYAYLTFEDDDYPIECGIHVCDISDPEDPYLVDRFVAGTGLDSDIQASGGRMRIWMNEDYAYLAKESAIIIVDVSDPENPSRKEIWHLPGMPPYSHVPSTEDLTGSGEYIYVTGDVDNQEDLLFVVNISDPLDPDLLGDVSIYRPNGVAVQGDYACIVGLNGFQIIDISDPDDPSVVGKVESTRQSGSGTGISVYGYGYGYGSPYLPGIYQSYPGFRYGYPLGGYGTSGGYGFGYPYGGLGTSGGYGYGYPYGGFGTSGGYGYPYNPYGFQRTNFASDLWGNPYSGIGGIGYPGYGFGYPFSGFGTSGGYGYGFPIGGYGTYSGYGYPSGWRPFY